MRGGRCEVNLVSLLGLVLYDFMLLFCILASLLSTSSGSRLRYLSTPAADCARVAACILASLSPGFSEGSDPMLVTLGKCCSGMKSFRAASLQCAVVLPFRPEILQNNSA